MALYSPQPLDTTTIADSTLTELLSQRDELSNILSQNNYGSTRIYTNSQWQTLQDNLAVINSQIDSLTYKTNESTSSSPSTYTVPQTDPALQDYVTGQITNPTLPEGTTQTFTTTQDQLAAAGIDPSTLEQTTDGKLITTADQVSSTATGGAAVVQTPGAQTAATADAYTVGDQVPQIETTQGALDPKSTISPTDVYQGTISSNAQVGYTQEELDTRATIVGQLSELFKNTAPGDIPSWAQPAVDMVNADLSARGVSRSSIARDSLYNAVIGTALNIAGQDAQSYKEAWLTNMDTKYKVAMFNAANVANMDIQNATAMQQAQMYNAQAFLQLDFKNMDNAQRTAEINANMRQQALLSDQAAQNAASQFNAESQNQVNQFNASLSAQIAMDNAARQDAWSQFTSQQEFDAQTFNAQLNFQRQQFNAQMTAQIEQSNIDWRREQNKINTAGINAVNQANITNLFNLSNQALTYAWQEARDNAYWAWMSSENDQERNTKLAMAALTNDAADKKIQASTWAAIGGFAADIIAGL